MYFFFFFFSFFFKNRALSIPPDFFFFFPPQQTAYARLQQDDPLLGWIDYSAAPSVITVFTTEVWSSSSYPNSLVYTLFTIPAHEVNM